MPCKVAFNLSLLVLDSVQDLSKSASAAIFLFPTYYAPTKATMNVAMKPSSEKPTQFGPLLKVYYPSHRSSFIDLNQRKSFLKLS